MGKKRRYNQKPTVVALDTSNMAWDETGATQYSDKPQTFDASKLVVNETVIRTPSREKLEIHKWRDAHKTAESRYNPNRSWLYDIYDDIMLDGHLTGIWEKRIGSVLNKHFVFKRNGQIVDDVTRLINTIAFRLVCRTILETRGWGISGIEFVPGKKFKPRIIPRKHINTKYQRITIEQDSDAGVDYSDALNLMIIGEPEDLGLLLKAAAYVIYKRNGLAEWAQYLTIFGQPIRVMKYETNDQQAKIELKQTLEKSGSSLALMIPKGVDFDLKDGKQSNGDGKLQETFTGYCDKQLSIIIIGNTETTTHDGHSGTGAKSEIHKEQQEGITKEDIFYLLNYLNSEQFLAILKSYGYSIDGGEFAVTQEISIKYLAERIKIDMLLIQAGLPIDHDYLYETYGIPKPKNYEELKAQMEKMALAIQKKAGNAQDDDPTDDEEDDIPAPKKKKKPAAIRREPVTLRSILTDLRSFFGQAPAKRGRKW